MLPLLVLCDIHNNATCDSKLRRKRLLGRARCEKPSYLNHLLSGQLAAAISLTEYAPTPQELIALVLGSRARSKVKRIAARSVVARMHNIQGGIEVEPKKERRSQPMRGDHPPAGHPHTTIATPSRSTPIPAAIIGVYHYIGKQASFQRVRIHRTSIPQTWPAEYHPDNEPQYRVLLRRLGASAAQAAGLSGPGIAA